MSKFQKFKCRRWNHIGPGASKFENFILSQLVFELERFEPPISFSIFWLGNPYHVTDCPQNLLKGCSIIPYLSSEFQFLPLTASKLEQFRPLVAKNPLILPEKKTKGLPTQNVAEVPVMPTTIIFPFENLILKRPWNLAKSFLLFWSLPTFVLRNLCLTLFQNLWRPAGALLDRTVARVTGQISEPWFEQMIEQAITNCCLAIFDIFLGRFGLTFLIINRKLSCLVTFGYFNCLRLKLMYG